MDLDDDRNDLLARLRSASAHFERTERAAASEVCQALQEWGQIGRLRGRVQMVYQDWARGLGASSAQDVCRALRDSPQSRLRLPLEVRDAFDRWTAVMSSQANARQHSCAPALQLRM